MGTGGGSNRQSVDEDVFGDILNVVETEIIDAIDSDTFALSGNLVGDMYATTSTACLPVVAGVLPIDLYLEFELIDDYIESSGVPRVGSTRPLVG